MKYIFNPYRRNPTDVEIESLESDGLTRDYFDRLEKQVIKETVETIAERARELYNDSHEGPVIGLNAAWTKAVSEYLQREVDAR